MNIRLYYMPTDGEILLAVIIGDDDWNLLESGRAVVGTAAKEITFPLTQENLERYMDGCHNVDLEEVNKRTNTNVQISINIEDMVDTTNMSEEERQRIAKAFLDNIVDRYLHPDYFTQEDIKDIKSTS